MFLALALSVMTYRYGCDVISETVPKSATIQVLFTALAAVVVFTALADFAEPYWGHVSSHTRAVSV